MGYDNYDIGKFVRDPFFQQWVVSPDAASDRFWTTWIAENPHKQFVVEDARRMILLLGFTTDTALNARLLDTWAALDSAGRREEPLSPATRRVSRTYMLRAAAAFAVLVMAAAGMWYFSFRTITVQTRFSEIRSVHLPDGSVVDLNGNSSIRYAAEWSDNRTREVWLEGEAFFSVAHDRNRKFVVHTAEGIEVNVLGTTFNVVSRRNTTRVSLNTGKIKINPGNKFAREDQTLEDVGFVMSPGEVAEFDARTSRIVRHVAPVEQLAAWKNRMIVFDNTPMRDVAAMLQDTHGLKVHVDEPLKMRKISGEFRSDDLDILIQFIATALNADVQKDAREIHFKSRQNKP